MFIQFKTALFTELSPQEVLHCMQLRQQVFIMEQTCLFMDIDGKDELCWHVLGTDEHAQIQAYARIVPPGLSFEEPSIGRICTSTQARGTGLGKKLVEYAISETQKRYPNSPIRIAAQLYLQKFYASFGFESVSEEYEEDEIPHIDMLLKP